VNAGLPTIYVNPFALLDFNISLRVDAVTALVIDPRNTGTLYAGTGENGVYQTTDGGASWELIHYRQLTSSTRVNPVWHPTDPDTAFAAGGWGGV